MWWETFSSEFVYVPVNGIGCHYIYHAFTLCIFLPMTSGSQGCQWDAGGKLFYTLGTATDVKWNVISPEDFTLTFGDGDQTYDGRFR